MGPVVRALLGCGLDAVYEFDVGALVDLGGVAGCEVGNEEADGAAGLHGQRLAVEAIDDQSPVGDGGERDAGVKVICRRMQTQIFGRGLGLHELQKARELYGVAFAARDEPAHVRYLVYAGNGCKVGKGYRPRLFTFAGNRKHSDLRIIQVNGTTNSQSTLRSDTGKEASAGALQLAPAA